MREWITFSVRPDNRSFFWKDSFLAQYDAVESWLNSNCVKSFRLKVIHPVHYSHRATSIKKIRSDSSASTNAYIQVKFRHERDSTLFKMYFGEFFFEPNTLDQVILPIIRRVMPNIIARELLGYQSMVQTVTGVPSQYYDPTLAAAITKTGQDVLEKIFKNEDLFK